LIQIFYRRWAIFGLHYVSELLRRKKNVAINEVKIFALTSRGLAWVGAQEMSRLSALRVDDVSYRRIAATCMGSLAPLLDLRCVDDLFLDLATWKDILPQRDALERIRQLSAQLDLEPVVGSLSAVRPIPERPAFSLTASFVGRRNYTWKEIKQSMAEGIRTRYPWPYEEDPDSDLNIRVFIDHQTAHVGLRLNDRPLHRRAYKGVHLGGSLKPSVAAALIQLAEGAAGSLLLDPFCGAGTILIEGASMGHQVFGGDIDPQALAATGENGRLAGESVNACLWDARHLPLANHSVQRVVSNLPWGRQVKVDQSLEWFYQQVCTEMRRVIAADGRIVLLTNEPQWVALPGLEIELQFEISLFGKTPAVMVFSGDTAAK
jgi:tRNA (guanine6-N2)-methyltransferase